MRQQAVGESVQAAVSVRVGVDGALEQREAQYVMIQAVAVLAVVQQRHAIIPLAEIDPTLRTDLEARPVPACVAMGRPFDRAELNLTGRARRVDRQRE